MKMVKSLLLGSAAGLVAVSAGQAADLPVKAKPVEYVKVCSLYGAGFYYMPGTDLCMKIGGWVRFEAGWGANGSLASGEYAGALNQRGTSNTTFRARGYITADVRNQTEYGTARGYLAVGISTNTTGLDTAANQFSANRAFLQWGGFTAGITQSFYDFYSTPATAYWGVFPASDTGDPGWLVAGYTAQLGNGISATLSTEERRMTQIIDQNGMQTFAGSGTLAPGNYIGTATTTVSTIALGASAAGFSPGAGAYGGQQVGDIVANLRVDQAWGSAQIMGAAHQVNASYDSSNATLAPSVLSTNHPGDVWGWAAGAGFKLNTPFISQGDYIQTQVNATKGALRYLFFGQNQNFGEVNGATEAFGVMSDAVYGGCQTSAVAPCAGGGGITPLQLTSAWGFNAAYEHFWVPNFRTSLYGGYDKVTYNAAANAMLCSGPGTGGAFGAGQGAAAVANPGCNMDWSFWFIGSRTQWDVTKTFYLGVDVLYEQMHSASLGVSTNLGAGNYAIGSAATIESHASAWLLRFRAHRDFLP